MGDSFVGIQARLMSQALVKLTGAVSRSNTALVFTNQLREIGVMFGNPDHAGRPGAEVLRLGAAGHPAGRDDQDRHRVGGQPRPRQGREEQGRAAVPGRGVRRDVRRGDLARGRAAGRRCRDGRGHQDRRLVHVRRDAARPGPRRPRSSSRRRRTSRARSTSGSVRRSARSCCRSRASKRPNRPHVAAPAASTIKTEPGGTRRAACGAGAGRVGR